MNLAFLLSLAVSIMLMLNLLRRRKYKVSAPKAAALSIGICVMGIMGTQILYYLENGSWSGKSFFGAVLFLPVLLYPIAKLAKMQLPVLLDYAVPPGVALLALFKFNCHIAGCCSGKVLKHTKEGIPIFFPSQLVEMAVAIVIMGFLLWLEYKGKLQYRIYPVTLLIYGSTRFILNYYRWEQRAFMFGLPPGNIWSLVSIAIGIIWLAVYDRRSRKKENL